MPKRPDKEVKCSRMPLHRGNFTPNNNQVGGVRARRVHAQDQRQGAASVEASQIAHTRGHRCDNATLRNALSLLPESGRSDQRRSLDLKMLMVQMVKIEAANALMPTVVNRKFRTPER